MFEHLEGCTRGIILTSLVAVSVVQNAFTSKWGSLVVNIAFAMLSAYVIAWMCKKGWDLFLWVVVILMGVSMAGQVYNIVRQ